MTQLNANVLSHQTSPSESDALNIPVIPGQRSGSDPIRNPLPHGGQQYNSRDMDPLDPLYVAATEELTARAAKSGITFDPGSPQMHEYVMRRKKGEIPEEDKTRVWQAAYRDTILNQGLSPDAIPISEHDNPTTAFIEKVADAAVKDYERSVLPPLSREADRSARALLGTTYASPNAGVNPMFDAKLDLPPVSDLTPTEAEAYDRAYERATQGLQKRLGRKLMYDATYGGVLDGYASERAAIEVKAGRIEKEMGKSVADTLRAKMHEQVDRKYLRPLVYEAEIEADKAAYPGLLEPTGVGRVSKDVVNASSNGGSSPAAAPQAPHQGTSSRPSAPAATPASAQVASAAPGAHAPRSTGQFDDLMANQLPSPYLKQGPGVREKVKKFFSPEGRSSRLRRRIGTIALAVATIGGSIAGLAAVNEQTPHDVHDRAASHSAPAATPHDNLHGPMMSQNNKDIINGSDKPKQTRTAAAPVPHHANGMSRTNRVGAMGTQSDAADNEHRSRQAGLSATNRRLSDAPGVPAAPHVSVSVSNVHILDGGDRTNQITSIVPSAAAIAAQHQAMSEAHRRLDATRHAE